VPIAFQSDMSRYCEDSRILQHPTYSDEITSRTRQIMGRGYQKTKKNKEANEISSYNADLILEE